MEIKLKSEMDELAEETERIMQPQILSLKDNSGKKVDFEIVSLLTMEKRIFTVVKNPNADVETGKLLTFEYVAQPGDAVNGRFYLVQDKATLQKVTQEYQKRLKEMDNRGLIP